jgi:hypothetical protein
LAYLGLIEILYGYPLDVVVLTTGCDKTTPAALVAAATTNLPAIVLSGGLMLEAMSGYSISDGHCGVMGTALCSSCEEPARLGTQAQQKW